jgi:hypothetical protein
LSWFGSSSGALRSSKTCGRGERWGEIAWHRWSNEKQRRCGGDGLPEGGSGGGTDKMNGRVLFYSCEHRDRWDSSGWRLALGHARKERARTHRRMRATRQTTAGDLRGDDAEGVLSVRRRQSSELDRGWCWTGPRVTHGRANAWCLRGAGLRSWRLDGPHVVSARKEEAEVLREASLPSSWHCDVTPQ